MIRTNCSFAWSLDTEEMTEAARVKGRCQGSRQTGRSQCFLLVLSIVPSCSLLAGPGERQLAEQQCS